MASAEEDASPDGGGLPPDADADADANARRAAACHAGARRNGGAEGGEGRD
jgi:hypothetical protein